MSFPRYRCDFVAGRSVSIRISRRTTNNPFSSRLLLIRNCVFSDRPYPTAPQIGIVPRQSFKSKLYEAQRSRPSTTNKHRNVIESWNFVIGRLYSSSLSGPASPRT